MTEVARDLGLEEAKEQITARGRERGFVTSDDLLESVPVDDFTPEQVEEFLTQVAGDFGQCSRSHTLQVGNVGKCTRRDRP